MNIRCTRISPADQKLDLWIGVARLGAYERLCAGVASGASPDREGLSAALIHFQLGDMFVVGLAGVGSPVVRLVCRRAVGHRGRPPECELRNHTSTASGSFLSVKRLLSVRATTFAAVANTSGMSRSTFYRAFKQAEETVEVA